MIYRKPVTTWIICLVILVGLSSLSIAEEKAIPRTTSDDTGILIKSPGTKVSKTLSSNSRQPVFYAQGWICGVGEPFNKVMSDIVNLKLYTRQMEKWIQALEYALKLSDKNEYGIFFQKTKQLLKENLVSGKIGATLLKPLKYSSLLKKNSSLSNALNVLKLPLTTAQEDYEPFRKKPQTLFTSGVNLSEKRRMKPTNIASTDGKELGQEQVFRMGDCLDSARINALTEALFQTIDEADKAFAAIEEKMDAIEERKDHQRILQDITSQEL